MNIYEIKCLCTVGPYGFLHYGPHEYLSNKMSMYLETIQFLALQFASYLPVFMVILEPANM